MWDKLKEILKVGGGKAVIVEDGEPKYIVLPVDEYLQLTRSDKDRMQQFPGGTDNVAAPESAAPSMPFNTPQPAADNESIFRGPIDPSGNEAPVDLSDIDAGDVPTLADYRGPKSGVDLGDLPL